MRNIKRFHIFALGAVGKGLSGGDRIFIELARRWQKIISVSIYVNEEGREMCRRQNLSESKNLKYVVWDTSRWRKIGFLAAYFFRIVRSIWEGLKIPLKNDSEIVVYSASEFWMDSLPALIIKLRYPKVIWAAAWYQTAPNPFKGYAEGNRGETYKFSAFLYWLSQLPIKPLIANFADYVLVNNENEKKQFHNLGIKKRVIIVLGAVDLEKIGKWQKDHGSFSKMYDAVFQGRFHPQKGVIELIDIWKKVVQEKPDAKLAMIGDGPLMKDVRLKIQDLRLEKNVKLFGYVFDGDEKYRIFAQSKIVVHPAFYDSGGMASAEAMAFGLPCVGFNLKAYESYYPKGMVKAKVGDLEEFANAILLLLDNEESREKISKDALEMLAKNWSWDKRAEGVLAQI